MTASDVAAGLRALIALTLERGALDNVTVVVVRYRPELAHRSGRPNRRPVVGVGR